MDGAEGGVGRPLRVGLYSPYFGSTYGGGEKYLGTAAEVLRDRYPQHSIEIVSPVPVDVERYGRVLGLDLSGIRLRFGTRRVTPLHRLVARAPGLRPLRNALVARQARVMTRDYDLWIAMAYVIPAISDARRSIMLCQFPYELRGERARHDLAAFHPIICQSEYVRDCVRRLWDRQAEVLPPPIDVPPEEPNWSRKRHLILSVGRFVASGHVKRHDVLIRAFRKLCASGVDDWELVLAGSLHRDAASLAYFRQIEDQARGYAIRILADRPLADLQRLYEAASIYWHAAGFGVDPVTHPEALEHFGMTTVEAMASGAVPVVIGRGGQPEVVEDGVSGYLWQTVDELVATTARLTQDIRLLERVRVAAREASRRYGRDTFGERLLQYLDRPIQEATAPASRELQERR